MNFLQSYSLPSNFKSLSDLEKLKAFTKQKKQLCSSSPALDETIYACTKKIFSLSKDKKSENYENYLSNLSEVHYFLLQCYNNDHHLVKKTEKKIEKSFNIFIKKIINLASNLGKSFKTVENQGKLEKDLSNMYRLILNIPHRKFADKEFQKLIPILKDLKLNLCKDYESLFSFPSYISLITKFKLDYKELLVANMDVINKICIIFRNNLFLFEELSQSSK